MTNGFTISKKVRDILTTGIYGYILVLPDDSTPAPDGPARVMRDKHMLPGGWGIVADEALDIPRRSAKL